MCPSPDDILAALDPEQRQVAHRVLGPMCVLAGAGTGKTRAITHRIAYGVHTGQYQPTNVLALTFTARAAGELRTRLRDLHVPGVQARTFHSAALRQLKYFWPTVFGGTMPGLVEHKAGLVRTAAESVKVATDKAVIRDLAGEIEWAKTSCITADRYVAAAGRHNRQPGGNLTPEAIARVIAAYEELKTERRQLDFEDVLLTMAAIMENSASAAETIRRQYRHFVVDEFQDVSPIQWQLLRSWLGDSNNLCVVGDAGQTIYSFAGATPHYLTTFPTQFPDATLVRLVRNYRSTAPVVQLANRVLASAPNHLRNSYVQLAAHNIGPATAPMIHCVADDDEEARWVADQIADKIRTGVKPADIAVLYRTNSQSEPFERALSTAGVGFVLRGGERFFARTEVRNAIRLLRTAVRAHAADDRPVNTIVEDVLAGAGWTTKEPEATGAVRQQWESLRALVDMAEHLAQHRPGSTLETMVRELDDRAEAQHAPTVQGVTLASLHAAKGLEWDHVFLVGACEGLIPISIAARPEDVEEERRLLYVGITRARQTLTISFAQHRHQGGRRDRKMSRFLTAHQRYAQVTRSRSASPAYRTTGEKLCSVCGAALTTQADRTTGRCATCPASYDEQLFEQLRRWRKAEAQESSVPAYVVLSDATLTAIAERLPNSTSQLLEVPGIGQTKAARYGEPILEIISEFSAKK